MNPWAEREARSGRFSAPLQPKPPQPLPDHQKRARRRRERAPDAPRLWARALACMATSFINDPEHWHNRAEEARTLAEQMNIPPFVFLRHALKDQPSHGPSDQTRRATQRRLKPPEWQQAQSQQEASRSLPRLSAL